MENSRKKKLLWAGILVIVLAVVFFAISCVATMAFGPEAKVTGARWGIALPDGGKRVYYTETDPGIFGDNGRYAVYQWKKGPEEFWQDFLQGRDASFEKAVDGLIHDRGIEIEPDWQPDWEEAYWCLAVSGDMGGDKAYFWYLPDSRTLILLQSYL